MAPTSPGWKLTEAMKDAWSVNGLNVTAKADVKGSNLDLWSEKSYKDFTMVADWNFISKPRRRSW